MLQQFDFVHASIHQGDFMIIWIKSPHSIYVYTNIYCNRQRKLAFVRKIALSVRMKQLSTILMDCKKLFNSTILLVGTGLNYTFIRIMSTNQM